MQGTFTDLEYANRRRGTKREAFLAHMEKAVDWPLWLSVIEPHYYQNKMGRKAIPLETILRMYMLSVWFNLSDEGCEDAIYDSYAMRRFMGIDFLERQSPDATTLCKFRKMMHENGLEQKLFAAVNEALEARGCVMRGGSIVDATIIEAPPSTRNSSQERDPEMKQTRKGKNDWHFGMKAHAGVDAGTGLIHTLETTAANEHDITVAHKLVRSDDDVVYGDSGYLGIEKREEIAENEHLSGVEYRVSRRQGHIKKLTGYSKTFEQYLQWRKSAVRAKVEYVFLIIKQTFGYKKTRYRGLSKNTSRLFLLAASANLLMLSRAGRLTS